MSTESANPAIEITHRPERSRYEISVDGEFAGIAAYEVADGGTFAATCPYVVHWLTKHHEYDDSLVSLA